MGKGQSPTPSELKFIYTLLAEGYSDADILAKYQELEKHSKLGSLPYREDIRFIRQRRKEFETARGIFEETLKQVADPILTKAREEHYTKIHSIIENIISLLGCAMNFADGLAGKEHCH